MNMIVGDLPRVNASRAPGASAIVDGDRRLSWEELELRSTRLAHALVDELGVGAQQTVAILAHNCLEYVELMIAASKAGLRWTGLNVRHHVEEMVHQLSDSESVVLLHQPGFAAVAAEAAERVGVPCVELGVDYEQMLAAASDVPIAPHGDADLPYALTYTSGTTGVARGALSSSLNDLAYGSSLVIATETRVDDIFMVMLPMFHKGGQFATMHALTTGRPMVILPAPVPDAMFAAIERERVSVFVAVPTIMRMMIGRRLETGPDAYDLSSIRHITYGSNPIPPEQIREFAFVFGCELSQIGGVGTEGGVGLSLSSRDHADAIADPRKEHVLASCGRVQPGVEMKLLDEEGQEVGVDEVGEMVFRGSAYISGYLNQPEANAKLWRNGWLHSGDLGRRDADGYVYYVERLGGRIKTGGEIVLAREVEEVVMACPGVQAVSVLGVPDPLWGEAVCAVIRPTGHADQGLAAAIQAHVRGQLAGYKVPRIIHFVDEIPLTALGKIARGKVKELVHEISERESADEEAHA